MEPVITFDVTNQIIKRTDNFKVVSDSRNYLKARFTFNTPEWIEPKTALFERGGKCWAQLLEKDACLVPWEFLGANGMGHGYVSVYCGNLVTSNQEIIHIIHSGYREGETPKPPEENIYQEILRKIDAKADDLKLDGTFLTLLSDGKEIGNRIRLPSGGEGGGREIELKNNGTAIQWRYTDSNDWQDLVLLEQLKGKDGQTPDFEIRTNGHLIAIYKE